MNNPTGMVLHAFSVSLAMEVGVGKAVLLHNIAYWIQQNFAIGRNEFDGKTWTYNTAGSFQKMIPYFTSEAIKKWLQQLEQDGYLISRQDLNKDPYNHTKWYTFGPRVSAGDSIQIEREILPNGREKTPDHYKEQIVNKTDSKQEKRRGASSTLHISSPKKFVQPTPQEVADYAVSIDFPLNGQAFCDFYASKGWMVGKSPMKDWKAAVRTWKRSQEKTEKRAETADETIERLKAKGLL